MRWPSGYHHHLLTRFPRIEPATPPFLHVGSLTPCLRPRTPPSVRFVLGTPPDPLTTLPPTPVPVIPHTAHTRTPPPCESLLINPSANGFSPGHATSLRLFVGCVSGKGGAAPAYGRGPNPSDDSSETLPQFIKARCPGHHSPHRRALCPTPRMQRIGTAGRSWTHTKRNGRCETVCKL